MRLGLLPSQQRALDAAFKKARKFDTFRQRTRRSFLVAGALGVGAAIGAFFVGRASVGWTDPTPESPLEARRQYARDLAQGPLAGLIDAHQSFLMVLNRVPPDAVMWSGFARLAEAAVARQDAQLAKRLLPTFSVHDVPEPTKQTQGLLNRLTR